MSLMNLMEFRDIVVVSLLRRQVFRVEEEDNRENDFGPFGLNLNFEGWKFLKGILLTTH
jgi:hypothetical protein